MKILLKSKDIIIKKLDEGNTVVILNRKDYVCKVKNILNDSSKFHKDYIDHDKILNHLIDMEKRVQKQMFLKILEKTKKSPVSNIRI